MYFTFWLARQLKYTTLYILAGIALREAAGQTFAMGVKAPLPAIRLSYDEATSVLMAALNQPGEARQAFQARIRQLQRIGLLKKPDGKAYERFTYGLVELAALATAFRLMAAFMLPMVSVRYVRERWTNFVPALLGGIGQELTDVRWDGEIYSETFVVVDGVALARLGEKGANDARYDGPLGSIATFGGEAKLDSVRQAGVSQGILIDTNGYMKALVSELRKLDFLSDEQISDDVERLRFSAL